jgi:SnoaL-like domain
MLNRKMLALIGIASFCGSAWLFAQKSTGKALTAQDLVDIQQLYAKYNWSLDSGDAEAYASTFTPDGVFNNNVGHDAIVKFANTFHGGMGAHVRHWNTNLLITPSAEGASGQVYLVLVDFASKPPSIVTSASYSDQLTKTPQGWRFKKRATQGDTVAPAKP